MLSQRCVRFVCSGGIAILAASGRDAGAAGQGETGTAGPEEVYTPELLARLKELIAQAEQLAGTERDKLHVRADRLIYDNLVAYMDLAAAEPDDDEVDCLKIVADGGRQGHCLCWDRSSGWAAERLPANRSCVRSR